MTRKKSVSIIGAGKVGSAFGYLLARAGYEIDVVVDREKKIAEKACKFIGYGRPTTDAEMALKNSRIIFITTNDDEIEKVVERLAKSSFIKPYSLFIHCSGALPAEIMKKGNYLTASIHPLFSFANPKVAIERLKGSYFAYEGDEKAYPEVIKIIRALKGFPVEINKENKIVYHCAASIASNFLITLASVALNMMREAIKDKELAKSAMLSLIKNTINNIEELDLGAALTGPILRLDKEVIRRHLQAIKDLCPQNLALYLKMAWATLDFAIKSGVIRESIGKIEEFKGLLESYKNEI